MTDFKIIESKQVPSTHTIQKAQKNTANPIIHRSNTPTQ